MKYIHLILITISCFSLEAQTKQDAWFTNQTEAMAYANENNASILMVFAGSDWCRPCIKFKKEILEATDFKAYANDHLAVLYLDFPSKKKNKLSKEATAHNEDLAEQYNQSGAFPKIVLLDKAMNKIKDLIYEGQSAQEFVSSIN